jgi:bla regulator protein blaR1
MISAIENHLLQSTLFGVAASAATFALRRHRAAVRYWIWLAASLKFLVPFAVLTRLGGLLPVRLPADAEPVARAAAVAVGSAGEILYRTPLRTSSQLPLELLGAIWALGALVVLAAWTVRWRRVRHSPRLEPGVVGLLHPTLVLPDGIAEHLTTAQLAAIVEHEQCHIRRRDNFFAALHMLAAAAFWFHPLVWWIGARLLDERERACDEEVLLRGGDPETYASAILVACRFYLESPVACVAGVTGSDLKLRIRRIMEQGVASRLGRRGKLLMGAAALAAIAGPVAIGLLQAQAPAFDVVSIKPADPDENRSQLRPMAGGGIHTVNVTVRTLFRFAYDLQDDQIAGGPAWLSSAGFNIEAKGGPTGLDKERLKLRAVLADRFQLKFHQEMKDAPIFLLTVAKGGLKIQPVQRDPKPDDGGFSWGRGRAVSQAAALSDFAFLLSGIVGRHVVDRTDVSGNFDFQLRWTPENYKPPADPGVRPRNEPLPDPDGPSIFSALGQLGLRLEPSHGPIPLYTIDSASKPAEN